MDAAGSDSRSGNHLQGTQPPNGQGLPPAGSGGDKCAESRKRRRERQIFCMWSKGSMFPKAMALPKPSECPLRAAPQCPRYLARRAESGGGGAEQPRGWEGPPTPLFMGSPPAAVTPWVWRLQVLLIVATHRCCLPTHPGGCPLNHPHLSPSSCLPTPPD